MTSRVTINAGLRWEPFFSQNLPRGANSIFDRDNFTSNVRTTMFHNAPAGLIYPGDAGFPDGNVRTQQEVDELLAARRRRWDVHGDGRMALRSSYGLMYDFPTGEFLSNPAAAPPYGNRARHGSAGRLRQPVP